MSGEKRILVVDDEPKILDVVRSYLEHGGYAVSTAENGREALARFHREDPALLILDWMLPDLPGDEVCREIRKESGVPIILLTAKTEEESILRGLRGGADDYVTKPFSPRQLVARVEAVLRRAEKASPSSLSFDGGELTIDLSGHTVTRGGEPVSLTPNEYRILSTLAGRPGRVFSRDELLSAVGGEEYEGFDRVIDTHIKNIRQKLGEESKNPRYLFTVHGFGYKFGGSAP